MTDDMKEMLYKVGGMGDPKGRYPRIEEDDDTQVYKKPWVNLTDEEIWSTVSRIGSANSDVNPYTVLIDARAIEAKLKEKNT